MVDQANGGDKSVQDMSAASEGAHDNIEQNRRSEEDRRAMADRRRSSRGLFELRARRDRIGVDRRQSERRGSARSRLFFWRRSASG